MGSQRRKLRRAKSVGLFLFDIFLNLLTLIIHAEKFLKRVFTINRLDGAFQRLDKLTQEEALMAEAETLVIAARIDKNVEDIVEGVTEAGENMQVVLKYVSDLNRS